MNKVVGAVGLFALSAAMGIAGNVDPSGYVYLNADDPGGQYSFAADNGRWYQNGAPIIGVPSTEYDYLVQGASGSGLRVIRVGSSSSFGGKSLTLDNGEIRMSEGRPASVGDLRVHYGMIQTAATTLKLKLDGATAIQAGGEIHFAGSGGRWLELSADVSGDATTKIVVDEAQPVERANMGTVLPPWWVVALSGDNSKFQGSLDVKALTAGEAYPSALVVNGFSALGDGTGSITFADRCALFGDGLNVDAPRKFVAAGDMVVGSYANGLTLGGGASIESQSGMLTVTNITGTTVFGDVVLTGFTQMLIQSGEVRFAAGYNNPELPIKVCAGATVSSEEGAVVGPISPFEANGYVSVAFPAVDKAALNRSNEGFSYPLLSAASLEMSDFCPYGGVTREYFTIAENAQGVPTLYWKRDLDEHPVVYMAESNDQGSFAPDGYKNWSDHLGTSAENDYIVENGKILRDRDSRTFVGHLLSLMGGSDLSFYDVKSTVVNLQMFEDCRTMVRGGNAATFSGSAVIRTSSGGYANFEAESGTITVAATLEGSGNVRYRGFGGVESYAGKVLVTGDNTAFVGKVSVPHAAMIVKFKDEDAIGGNPAKFVKDGLSLGAGVTFWCESDYAPSVMQPNRGVTLDGAVNFDVAEGQTCTMGTPIAGIGSIVKKSAGALVLGGVNTFAGGVTLNAGTLVLANADALGGGNLRLATGTTLSLEAAGIKVNGEIPFSTADGSSAADAISIVIPAADAEGFKSQELFVLTGVQDFDCAKFVLPNAGQFKFVKTLASDGLHIVLKKRFGLVLMMK